MYKYEGCRCTLDLLLTTVEGQRKNLTRRAQEAVAFA
jgi:hypothetical protein